MHKNSGSSLFRVITIKPFFLLWSAQVITQIAFNMLVFVLGVIIYGQTRSNTHVSLLYLTVGLPAALSGIFSGVVVDNYNKRRILFLSAFVRAILLFFIIFFKNNLSVVFILMALISVASQFFVPAEAALIPKFVEKKLLLSANSLFTLTFYSAIIGGFVAGGPLMELLQESTLLSVLACLFLGTSVILLFLPKSVDYEFANPAKLTFSSIKSNISSVLTYIFRKELIRDAILLLTLAQVVISVFMTLGPGFADRILEIKLTDASFVILGPAALGMILGALVIGSFGARFRKRNLITWGIFISGVLLLIISGFVRMRRYTPITTVFEHIFSISLAAGFLPVSIAVFLLLGFANSMIDISCNTILQEHTESDMRGRVYGVLSTLISGVALLPVVVSGILADAFGVGKIIFVLGALLTMFGLYTRGIFKKLA